MQLSSLGRWVSFLAEFDLRSQAPSGCMCVCVCVRVRVCAVGRGEGWVNFLDLSMLVYLVYSNLQFSQGSDRNGLIYIYSFNSRLIFIVRNVHTTLRNLEP